MDLAASFAAEMEERHHDDPMDESWWGVPDTVLPHLSPSSVGMFMRCPLQFWHRYVHGVKAPPKWTMVLGSANHDSHQWALEQKVEGRDIDAGTVVERFNDEVWPGRLALEPEVDWGKPGERSTSTPDKARAMGERMVEAYASTVIPRLEPISAMEERVDMWVPGLPIPVMGYVDCRLAGPVVWDLKTVASKTSTISGRWQLQARTYAAATGEGVEYHTVSRAQTPAVVTPAESPALLLLYDPLVAERTVGLYRSIAEQIALLWRTHGPERPWPANFMSDACGWCGYWSTCPQWRTS